jgi:hypothetical protein
MSLLIFLKRLIKMSARAQLYASAGYKTIPTFGEFLDNLKQSHPKVTVLKISHQKAMFYFLGDKGGTIKEAKLKARCLKIIHHPDKNPNNIAASTIKFQEIQLHLDALES